MSSWQREEGDADGCCWTVKQVRGRRKYCVHFTELRWNQFFQSLNSSPSLKRCDPESSTFAFLYCCINKELGFWRLPYWIIWPNSIGIWLVWKVVFDCICSWSFPLKLCDLKSNMLVFTYHSNGDLNWQTLYEITQWIQIAHLVWFHIDFCHYY